MNNQKIEQLLNIVKKLKKEMTGAWIIIVTILVIGFFLLYIGLPISNFLHKFSKNSLGNFLLFWALFILLFLIYLIIKYNKQNLHRKEVLKLVSQGIENNLLIPISVKVLGFDIFDYYLYKYHWFTEGDPSHIRIIVGDKNRKYSTEKFNGNVFGYSFENLTLLRNFNIDYNPLDLQGMIQEIDKINNPIGIWKRIKSKNNGDKIDQQYNKIISVMLIFFKTVINNMRCFLKNCTLFIYSTISLHKLETLKLKFEQQINSGDKQIPYAIINGKRINIGDNITVYIYPNNPDIFIVDTIQLYN